MEEREVDGYIPETEERDIGKEQRRNPKLYGKGDFQYDQERDCYICPAGECLRCREKAKCTETKNKVGRGVTGDRYEGERARMREKLKTGAGRKIYAKRKYTVEPVFGQIRIIEKFIQFLLRGLEGVRIEWEWAAIVHNLLKIIRKIQVERAGWGGVAEGVVTK